MIDPRYILWYPPELSRRERRHAWILGLLGIWLVPMGIALLALAGASVALWTRDWVSAAGMVITSVAMSLNAAIWWGEKH